MKKYLLIRERGRWKLKREGASRALVDFGNRGYEDFDQVFYVAMTYAGDMESLTIMNDSGTVRTRLDGDFVELYRVGKK